MHVVSEAPVVRVERLPRNNFLLRVRAPEIARTVQPGQFVMASHSTGDSIPWPLLKRALAVYSVADENGKVELLDLVFKVVGDGTRRLSGLRPGDGVEMIGPLGNGFRALNGEARVHVLIAGGIGIASVYFLARRLREAQESVHLVYGGRTADDLVLLPDFEELGIPTSLTTEDGSRGLKGLITRGLLESVDRYSQKHLQFYTCGPTPMMRAVCELAVGRGIDCQLSVEVRMACGFGACLGCSVKTRTSYRLACRQGPVFDASEFVWEEE